MQFAPSESSEGTPLNSGRPVEPGVPPGNYIDPYPLEPQDHPDAPQPLREPSLRSQSQFEGSRLELRPPTRSARRLPTSNISNRNSPQGPQL